MSASFCKDPIRGFRAPRALIFASNPTRSVEPGGNDKIFLIFLGDLPNSL